MCLFIYLYLCWLHISLCYFCYLAMKLDKQTLYMKDVEKSDSFLCAQINNCVNAEK